MFWQADWGGLKLTDHLVSHHKLVFHLFWRTLGCCPYFIRKCVLWKWNQRQLLKYIRNSATRKMEYLYFPLFLPQSTTKNLGHYVKKKRKKTLRSGEETQWLAIWGPKEQHGDKLPGIFFFHHISQTWTWRSQWPRNAKGYRCPPPKKRVHCMIPII